MKVAEEDKEDDGDDGENFDYYNFGNNNSNNSSSGRMMNYDDDVTGDVRIGGGGSGNGGGAGEWSDPWPTNDDWRRFRRRFQKAVRQSLEVMMERNRLACLAAAEAAEAEAAKMEENNNDASSGGVGKQQAGGKTNKGGSNGGGRATKRSGKGTVMATAKAAERTGGRANRETGAEWEWEWERQQQRERDPLQAGFMGERSGRHASTRIRVPAIKGASLLWRYTRGGYV